jgi:LPS-assembly lipoprotein
MNARLPNTPVVFHHCDRVRSMYSRPLIILGAVALLVLLSACGFHLRGDVELPPLLQDTYIESDDPFTGIARPLRAQLERSGATVLETRDQASAVLRIIGERSENRVLSVGSSGKATEYELFNQVVFSLSDAAGKVLVGPQTVRMTRDLTFDETELLGKLSEAEGIHRQMLDSLARQILTRIQVGMQQR